MKVLKNDKLQSRMIAEGYKHALTMTDKISAQQMMDIYKSL